MHKAAEYDPIHPPDRGNVSRSASQSLKCRLESEAELHHQQVLLLHASWVSYLNQG